MQVQHYCFVEENWFKKNDSDDVVSFIVNLNSSRQKRTKLEAKAYSRRYPDEQTARITPRFAHRTFRLAQVWLDVKKIKRKQAGIVIDDVEKPTL